MGNKARILIDGEQLLLDIPGKWKLHSNRSNLLSPGDQVEIELERGSWRLRVIIPRRNEFTRRATGAGRTPSAKAQPQSLAVNLDLVLVMASIADPVTPPGQVDRLLATAELGGVNPVLVVNKIDLAEDDDIEFWTQNYSGAADELLFTSAVKGIGLDILTDLIKNKMVLLVGASGVGKSSLVNRIDPNLNLKTTRVSVVTGKGRHATSSSEFFPLAGGGWIADTPGLRECSPWGMTPENIDQAFPEIRRLKGNCKFRNCRHRSEMDCIVRQVVGTKRLPEIRYIGYLKLLAEAELYAGFKV
ncbi:MAG: ribosome small subunit-dependent GTPase A [Calditrichota bacterium]